ncbi:MAG: gephyrin-like molybdotransferase Glp [Aquificaceae bacterium]
MSLISYDEALSLVLENTKRVDTEKVPLDMALYRVLAEDVFADTDKPPFDSSAMDGYAVKYEDIKSASEESPIKLKVLTEIPAGAKENNHLKRGEAALIFTGAPIPGGVDVVVPLELTHTEEGFVFVKHPLKRGSNIRKRGEEVKKGEKLIESGTWIRPYEVGLMASVNKVLPQVYRRPRVGILSTGDEIKDIGDTLEEPSQIRSSNGHILLAQVLKSGGEACYIGIVKDNSEEIRKALECMHSYDVFITTGGVSAGGKDYTQYIVKDMGVDVKFHRLRIKPAKPVLFGVYGNSKLFFGLPGNPVSCTIAFDLFVYPALLKMVGRRDFAPNVFRAILEEDFYRRDGERREFVRAKVSFREEKAYCSYSPKTQSHMLTSYVDMNAYMIVYEGVKELKKGGLVDVIMFP